MSQEQEETEVEDEDSKYLEFSDTVTL